MMFSLVYRISLSVRFFFGHAGSSFSSALPVVSSCLDSDSGGVCVVVSGSFVVVVSGALVVVSGAFAVVSGAFVVVSGALVVVSGALVVVSGGAGVRSVSSPVSVSVSVI